MFVRHRCSMLPTLIATACLCFATVAAEAIETEAKQAILVDYETGAVMLEKNADEPMHPASMTKIMTAYLLFERVDDGSMSLQDTLPVSEKAWRKGGSKMFIEVGARVTVEDLVRGIVVQSGNDATIAVAEGLAGSEEAFADRMTQMGREIGMTNTVFRNASGWPDPEHKTTARDLAILSIASIRNHPAHYHYYAERTFTYNGITQANRNPLLYRNVGADGLKTGHTEASGYGLAASAERNGRRLILVVNGLPSTEARAQESERLLDWGFREWESYKLFAAGEKVADAVVWLGEAATVPLVVEDPVAVTMLRRARKDMRVAVRFEGPIAAPISAGDRVAELSVTAPEYEGMTVPLVAGASVERQGPVGRVGSALRYLVWGKDQ